MDTEGPPVTHSNAAPAPTKRSVGKAKTREKISHAAKAMFMSHGFDGANLRAIAAEAGLSTGALFANFENKADLFNAIVVTEYGLLADAFGKTPQLGEDALSDLLALMDAAYGFFWPQLPFAQALFSTDWTSSPSLYHDREKAFAPILAQIASTLEQGKAAGKVRKAGALGVGARHGQPFAFAGGSQRDGVGLVGQIPLAGGDDAVVNHADDFH